MYFLRFTTNAKRDLKRGYSNHFNDNGKREKLCGLCGFQLEAETLEEAIEEVKENFANQSNNTVYNIDSFGTDWAIFLGSYRDSVPDGHVFIPKTIEYQAK